FGRVFLLCRFLRPLVNSAYLLPRRLESIQPRPSPGRHGCRWPFVPTFRTLDGSSSSLPRYYSQRLLLTRRIFQTIMVSPERGATGFSIPHSPFRERV